MFGWIPGSKKGKGMVSLEDMVKNLQEIANDPVKYRAYQLDLAKYAWQQARIYGYKGTPTQFLNTLGLNKLLKSGKGIADKIADKVTKSGFAGGPWMVDFKKNFEVLTQPGLWKMTYSNKEVKNMKMRVSALKRSYDAV